MGVGSEALRMSYTCYSTTAYGIQNDALISSTSKYTVEPVYNGHPRDLRNWPLNTGSRLIQDP